MIPWCHDCVVEANFAWTHVQCMILGTEKTSVVGVSWCLFRLEKSCSNCSSLTYLAGTRFAFVYRTFKQHNPSLKLMGYFVLREPDFFRLRSRAFLKFLNHMFSIGGKIGPDKKFTKRWHTAACSACGSVWQNAKRFSILTLGRRVRMKDTYIPCTRGKCEYLSTVREAAGEECDWNE